MDEKEVLKKLDEIKRKRLDRKEAAIREKQKNEPATPNNGLKPIARTGEALPEDEIDARMKKWRDAPEPDCDECGACPVEECEDKKGD